MVCYLLSNGVLQFHSTRDLQNHVFLFLRNLFYLILVDCRLILKCTVVQISESFSFACYRESFT